MLVLVVSSDNPQKQNLKHNHERKATSDTSTGTNTSKSTSENSNSSRLLSLVFYRRELFELTLKTDTFPCFLKVVGSPFNVPTLGYLIMCQTFESETLLLT